MTLCLCRLWGLPHSTRPRCVQAGLASAICASQSCVCPGRERNETMTMKVGRIPYLSCEPFYFDMERRGMALYDVVPSAMAGAITQGDIDAGPVPLADCFRLTDQCRYLSGFCLATIRKAGSVLLHAKHPIETLTGARIGIPGEAVTSLRLLQMLLA